MYQQQILKETRDKFRNEIRKLNIDQIFTQQRQRFIDKQQSSESDLITMIQKVMQQYDNFGHYIDCIRIKLSQKNQTIPFDEIIDLNFPQFLFQALENPQIDNQVVHHILWILTNLCTANSVQIQKLIDLQIIDVLNQQIIKGNFELTFEAFWTFGNIAASSIQHRDLLIYQGIIQAVCCSIFQFHDYKQDLYKTISWLMKTLTRHPTPPIQKVNVFLMISCDIIKFFNDDSNDEVLTNCCLTIAQLSLDNQQIEQVLQTDVLETIFDLSFKCQNHQLQLSILQILSNLSLCNSKQSQKLGDMGIYEVLDMLLDKRQTNIRLSAIQIISNLNLDHSDNVQKFTQILSKVLRLIIQDEYEVQKWSIQAICNCFKNGSIQSLQTILDKGSFTLILNQACQNSDQESILQILEVSQIILDLSRLTHVPIFIEQYKQADVYNNIYQLQYSNNQEISTKAIYQIEKYLDQDFIEEEQ